MSFRGMQFFSTGDGSCATGKCSMPSAARRIAGVGALVRKPHPTNSPRSIVPPPPPPPPSLPSKKMILPNLEKEKFLETDENIPLEEEEKHAICCCCFGSEGYVEQLSLLLQSIDQFGELTPDTAIFIYTSSELINHIRRNVPIALEKQVRFFLAPQNLYKFDACKSRLEFFQQLDDHRDYTHILYLDIDIIIHAPLEPLFSLLPRLPADGSEAYKDRLLAIAEGRVDIPTNSYYGQALFAAMNPTERPRSLKIDPTAFSSGVLLFRNSPRMRRFFSFVRETVDKNPHLDVFGDQPFLNFGARVLDVQDHFTLTLFLKKFPTLVHFAGNPGEAEVKIPRMQAFLETYSREIQRTPIDHQARFALF